MSVNPVSPERKAGRRRELGLAILLVVSVIGVVGFFGSPGTPAATASGNAPIDHCDQDACGGPPDHRYGARRDQRFRPCVGWADHGRPPTTLGRNVVGRPKTPVVVAELRLRQIGLPACAPRSRRTCRQRPQAQPEPPGAPAQVPRGGGKLGKSPTRLADSFVGREGTSRPLYVIPHELNRA